MKQVSTLEIIHFMICVELTVLLIVALGIAFYQKMNFQIIHSKKYLQFHHFFVFLKCLELYFLCDPYLLLINNLVLKWFNSRNLFILYIWRYIFFNIKSC